MAERKINGTTYRTDPMLARESLALLAKLIKVGGSGWEKLKATALSGKKISKQELMISSVDALVDIVKANPTDEILAVMDEVLGHAKRHTPSGDHLQVEIDHFTDLGEMFNVLGWVLEVQFAGFFGEIDQNGKAKAKAA